MKIPDTTPLFKETRSHQSCTRCLLDTVGPHPIDFDEDGVCNYCRDYDKYIRPSFLAQSVKKKAFSKSIEEIKRDGVGRKYDCIMGLSGGLDSSFVAYIAMVHGLRPLIVHLDNGWDAELAVKNIENIIKKTGFDYFNYVVDWEEFKDMQLAYLKASVIDTEVVTDQAIFAILHIVAEKMGIRYILFGDNPKTERIMPKNWNFRKNDLANMLAIHEKYGTKKLKSYPLMGQYDLEFYRRISGIRYVSLLHYVDYDRKEMLAILEEEFGWRDYRWKHCESVFTQFYQGYILPKKYGVDKRKAHLSDMVLSGQMNRGEAEKKMQEPYYLGDGLQEDYDFALRKFGLSAVEFEAIMALPPVSHEDFPIDQISRWQEIKLSFWGIFLKFSRNLKNSGRKILGPGTWNFIKSRWMRTLEDNLDKKLG
jgi:N-acetyl sugar amidotransferase